MSFDNGTELSFFSASSPSNDFAISIAQGFSNFSATECGFFFFGTQKSDFTKCVQQWLIYWQKSMLFLGTTLMKACHFDF